MTVQTREEKQRSLENKALKTFWFIAKKYAEAEKRSTDRTMLENYLKEKRRELIRERNILALGGTESGTVRPEQEIDLCLDVFLFKKKYQQRFTDEERGGTCVGMRDLYERWRKCYQNYEKTYKEYLETFHRLEYEDMSSPDKKKYALALYTYLEEYLQKTGKPYNRPAREYSVLFVEKDSTVFCMPCNRTIKKKMQKYHIAGKKHTINVPFYHQTTALIRDIKYLRKKNRDALERTIERETEDEKDDESEEIKMQRQKDRVDENGNPIPSWLWKHRQLNKKYVCEICTKVCRGRASFERHFGEDQHRKGLLAHNIEYTSVFFGIASIHNAKKLKKKETLRIRREEFVSDQEEVEDEDGNVYDRKTHEEAKKKNMKTSSGFLSMCLEKQEQMRNMAAAEKDIREWIDEIYESFKNMQEHVATRSMNYMIDMILKRPINMEMLSKKHIEKCKEMQILSKEDILTDFASRIDTESANMVQQVSEEYRKQERLYTEFKVSKLDLFTQIAQQFIEKRRENIFVFIENPFSEKAKPFIQIVQMCYRMNIDSFFIENAISEIVEQKILIGTQKTLDIMRFCISYFSVMQQIDPLMIRSSNLLHKISIYLKKRQDIFESFVTAAATEINENTVRYNDLFDWHPFQKITGEEKESKEYDIILFFLGIFDSPDACLSLFHDAYFSGITKRQNLGLIDIAYAEVLKARKGSSPVIFNIDILKGDEAFLGKYWHNAENFSLVVLSTIYLHNYEKELFSGLPIDYDPEAIRDAITKVSLLDANMGSLLDSVCSIRRDSIELFLDIDLTTIDITIDGDHVNTTLREFKNFLGEKEKHVPYQQIFIFREEFEDGLSQETQQHGLLQYCYNFIKKKLRSTNKKNIIDIGRLLHTVDKIKSGF